jgi:phage baseplate assembly protein W
MTTRTLSDKKELEEKSYIVSRRKQYSDLNLKLKAHPSHGDITPLKDIEAVKQSVKNLIVTSKRERLFQPWLGAGVSDLLFEPADNITISSIKQEMYRVIEKYEPRVKIQYIQVIDKPDANAYLINIKFLIINLVEEVNVEFFLQRVR